MMEEEISCNRVMEFICEHLGEDFDSPECEVIRLHIDHCENCHNFLHTVKTTIILYQNYNVVPSEEIHRKLWDILELDDE